MRCCLGPEFKEKRMYHRVRVTDTICSSQVDEWNANQGMSSSWFPLPMTSLSKYDGGLLNVTCGPQSGPTNLPDRPAVISAETDLSEADPDLTIQLNIYCLGRYLLSGQVSAVQDLLYRPRPNHTKASFIYGDL
jgi:hypothetical protein